MILRSKVSIHHYLRGDRGSRHLYTVQYRHTLTLLELLSNLTRVIVEAYLDALWEQLVILRLKVCIDDGLRGGRVSRHFYVLHHRHITLPLDLLKVLTKVIVDTYLDHL